MPSAETTIDTGRVQSHRSLRFETIDEALREVEHLIRAEQAGRLSPIGNWTLGQTLGHLATWAEYAFTEPPLKPPPLPIQLIIRIQKYSIINKRMPRGVKLPGVSGGTLGTEPMPTEKAATRLRAALERLRTEAPTLPNIVFGKLSHEEWIKLNLRHAELHLGYLIEQSGP